MVTLKERNEIVSENIKLVYDVISRMKINSVDNAVGKEDLIQVGCLALMKAAETYDCKKGKFSTYAEVLIKNALLDEIRKGYLAVNDKENRKPKSAVTVSFCEFAGEAPMITDGGRGEEIEAAIGELDAKNTWEAIVNEILADPRASRDTVLLGLRIVKGKSRGYSIKEMAAIEGVEYRHAWAAAKQFVDSARASRSAQYQRAC